MWAAPLLHSYVWPVLSLNLEDVQNRCVHYSQDVGHFVFLPPKLIEAVEIFWSIAIFHDTIMGQQEECPIVETTTFYDIVLSLLAYSRSQEID